MGAIPWRRDTGSGGPRRRGANHLGAVGWIAGHELRRRGGRALALALVVGVLGAVARVALRIVGIARRPLDLSDRAESGGFLVLTPAFERAYAGRIGVFGSYLRIRTRGGAAGSAAAVAVARRTFGPSLFDTEGLA